MVPLPKEWLAARAAGKVAKRGDVSGADLRGADLSELRLELAIASGADLRGAQCENLYALDCNFERVNFEGADLKYARFMDCVLVGANLRGCLLEGVSFFASTLDGCNFEDAVLTGANLGGAFCIGTRFTDADLTGANAKQALFTDADLSNADLRGGNFDRASFEGANLSGVRWEGANLEGATFDPGTGKRLLQDALSASPQYPLTAYVAYELTEGNDKSYSIERRDDSSPALRVVDLKLQNGRLELSFERLAPDLPPLVGYALIVFALLGDFLANRYDSQAKPVVFKDLQSKTTFVLPS